MTSLPQDQRLALAPIFVIVDPDDRKCEVGHGYLAPGHKDDENRAAAPVQIAQRDDELWIQRGGYEQQGSAALRVAIWCRD
jgi:hypothetical protein